MPATPQQLAQFLLDNPEVIAAYNDSTPQTQFVRVLLPVEVFQNVSLDLKALADFEVRQVSADQFKPLICPPGAELRSESHVTCQNEPIKLGTQLQPAGAAWVGTAGLPVQWHDPGQKPRWGILSNWHVMVPPPAREGHCQHQPDDSFPCCATLAKWAEVNEDEPNHIDAALADALVDGYHTIANEILEVGPLGDTPIVAQVGLRVKKSGRTTGLTFATCEATGAAVRVGYGDFTAAFVDQDIFRADNGEFSAPGDSGSAILGRACNCPCSLLFAGNSELTVGNPMRFIIEAFNLVFPFS